MSNIPPLLSSSPPPMIGHLEEDEDDEFGDFRAASDSFTIDENEISFPSTPTHKGAQKEKIAANLDINSNKHINQTKPNEIRNEISKDNQDRRKSIDSIVSAVNSSDEISISSEYETKFDELNEKTEADVNLAGVLDSFEVRNLSEPELSESIKNDCVLKFSEGVLKNCDDFTTLDENTSICDSAKLEFYTPNEKTIEPSEDGHISDDFGDFLSPNVNDVFHTPNNEIIDKSEDDKSDYKTSNYQFGDSSTDKLNFADFGTNLPEVETSDDEFGDFSTPVVDNVENDDPDDDFGDFSDFTNFTPQQSKSIQLMDQKNAFELSETVLKAIFPEIPNEICDYVKVDKEDFVFHELRDITETHALVYQWAKSNSQKMFFKSLNIDLRNILYGPSWNSSMPRFAANLSLQPLEPIKQEILTPIVVPPPSTSQNSDNGCIPSAQFDWTGSGLVNPLDLQKVPEEPKLDDFLPESPKFIPLRETYIITEPIKADLPIKKVENEEVEIKASLEDEFDDFQMSLPVTKPEVVVQEVVIAKPVMQNSTPAKNDEDEFSEFQSPILPLQPKQIELLKPSVQYQPPKLINWPEPGVSDDDLRNIELFYGQKNENSSEKKVEDEWSDFVSVKSTLKQQTQNLTLSVMNLGQVQAPKAPIPVVTPSGLMQTKLATLQTVKPTVLQTTKVKNDFDTFQPSIISRQYVANLYEGVSSSNDGFSPSHAPKPSKADEEEDWSDFVSSQPVNNGGMTNIIANPFSDFEFLGFSGKK